MAGQIRRMIDEIIGRRAKGSEVVAITTKAKINLKGINTDLYTATSSDDPEVIAKLRTIAIELGVSL